MLIVHHYTVLNSTAIAKRCATNMPSPKKESSPSKRTRKNTTSESILTSSSSKVDSSPPRTRSKSVLVKNKEPLDRNAKVAETLSFNMKFFLKLAVVLGLVALSIVFNFKSASTSLSFFQQLILKYSGIIWFNSGSKLESSTSRGTVAAVERSSNGNAAEIPSIKQSGVPESVLAEFVNHQAIDNESTHKQLKKATTEVAGFIGSQWDKEHTESSIYSILPSSSVWCDGDQRSNR